MPNDLFYKTPEWKALRLFVCRRDGWRCVVCNAPVHGRGQSRVDHVKPRTQFPALALDARNLRTLCATCDNQRHRDKLHADTLGADASGAPLDPAHHWHEAVEDRGVTVSSYHGSPVRVTKAGGE